MSTDIWTEESLLERYKVFNYIYFIKLRPIFLNHLRKLYKIYNIDLRSDSILLSFYPINEELKSEKDIKEMQYIKTELLENPYFLKRTFDLSQITLRQFAYCQYKVDVFVLEENRKRFEREKVQNYNALFEEISNNLFQYFLNMKFSVASLDKIILLLKIKNSFDLHQLPCLVSAFFHFILYRQSKQ